MAYEEAQNVSQLFFRDFSAGWFPGKEHNEIPGEMLNDRTSVGASDCDHVIWNEGALRKIAGFNKVQTTALNSGADVNGLIDFTRDSHNLVGVVGDKIYEDLHTVSPTDITGSVNINAAYLCDMQEFGIGSTKMVIGVNGQDAPWKWTGTSNAAALGGSPPTCRWVEYFNNYIFLGNQTTNAERVYFSALSDPETWDTTNDFFTFDAPITGMKTLGRQLVVFKRDSIGIISGFGTASWQKIDNFVQGVGCAGGHTIVNARLGGDGQNNRDGLVFLSDDGIYFFDGTPNVIKISNPIQRKFISSTTTELFNASRFEYAWATYSEKYDWYILHLSDGSATDNDFRLILDLSRPYTAPDGRFSVPHWPSTGIDATSVVTRKVDGKDELYMGGSDGFIRLYDPARFNEDDDTYNACFFQSKILDARSHWILRELDFLGDELGDTDVTIGVSSDLEGGIGDTADVNMQDVSDLLDVSFIIGTSTLGGKDFLYKAAALNKEGRFMQFYISQNTINKQMVCEGLDMILKNVGRRPNA